MEGIKKNGSVGKTCAAILLVLSLILMFFPWISCHVVVMGQKVTIPDLIEMAAASEWISTPEMEREIREEIRGACQALNEEGFKADASAAIRMYEAVRDGRISPAEALQICTFAQNFLREMNLYINDYEAYEYTDAFLIGLIRDAAVKVTAAASVLWVLAAGLVICSVIILRSLWSEKTRAAVLLPVLYLVTGILFYGICVNVNDTLSGLGNDLSWLISDLTGLVGGYSAKDLELMHLTWIPAAGLLCTAGVPVLAATDISGSLGKKAVSARPGKGPGTKVCSSCGKPIRKDSVFCVYCGKAAAGKEAPGKRVCSRCGNPVREGYAFCTRCGNPVEERILFG